MDKPQKDELLERMLFSDGLVEAYARPEQGRSEPAGDHWTRPVLLERIAYLRKLARFSEGAAFDIIRELPGYELMLMVLLRSSDAAADEKHGLTFVVLDGQATLVTGGTLESPRRISAGEIRGAGIKGGASRELRRGDVVHIGAGNPHQFHLSGEKGFACLKAQVCQESASRAGSGL